MAEETEEKELDLEAEDGEVAEAAPGKSKKLIMIGAAVALLAIAGGGAFFFLGGEPESTEEVVEEEPPLEEVHYLDLEPAFIINLPDRGRQRFLQASVTVMAHNRGAILTVERHMPAIRHSLSSVLSSQTLQTIQSPGGIEQVRIEATEQLNRILLDEYGSEAIEDVLFTAFVMQ